LLPTHHTGKIQQQQQHQSGKDYQNGSNISFGITAASKTKPWETQRDLGKVVLWRRTGIHRTWNASNKGPVYMYLLEYYRAGWHISLHEGGWRGREKSQKSWEDGRWNAGGLSRCVFGCDESRGRAVGVWDVKEEMGLG